MMLDGICDLIIQKYVVKLKSLTTDCTFMCPGCNYDLQSDINLWDHLIQGLCN